jgi:hypothetical protein
MKKKSILYVLIITIFATVLMGCDLSLDVPPHDWMIGNWKGNLVSNDTTLNITASNIVINYDGQEIDLGVAGFFVNITEKSPNENEYVITYTKGNDVIKFTLRPGATADDMTVMIDDNGTLSGLQGYYKL